MSDTDMHILWNYHAVVNMNTAQQSHYRMIIKVSDHQHRWLAGGYGFA